MGNAFSQGSLPPPVSDGYSVSMAEGRVDTAYDVTAGVRTVAKQELSGLQNAGWILAVWRLPGVLGGPRAREGPSRGVLLLLCYGSPAPGESLRVWTQETGRCLWRFCGPSPTGCDPGLRPSGEGFLPVPEL